ncbi:LysR family transcriptional regulator [Nocardioides sp.]|uniref:LysR family transcriptional regulator n=1 Tax=Nocardioides sp. TaxID=35761 RepID=UPI002C0F32CD|nr:LysR family transcriptional regulator [Nocardioides sp.]HSX68862.1 LysR family transcriptional regulator [Nocardioides sp.]
MDLRLVRAFVAIAHEGSISGAARQLGYSQPAITQQLKDLEHLVGRRLFDRSSTAVTLTSAGRDRLALAELMLVLERRLLLGLEPARKASRVGAPR